MFHRNVIYRTWDVLAFPIKGHIKCIGQNKENKILSHSKVMCVYLFQQKHIQSFSSHDLHANALDTPRIKSLCVVLLRRPFKKITIYLYIQIYIHIFCLTSHTVTGMLLCWSLSNCDSVSPYLSLSLSFVKSSYMRVYKMCISIVFNFTFFDPQ